MFTIEGYTDSIGTYEYNLDLSQRRADNMKQYLVEALGIDPSHIDARGRGSTKFIVPPRPVGPSASQAEFDIEIERERANRRVEVTINDALPNERGFAAQQVTVILKNGQSHTTFVDRLEVPGRSGKPLSVDDRVAAFQRTAESLPGDAADRL